MCNTNVLPDKLWELILVALADEAKAHRSPFYNVIMAVWHEPIKYDDGKFKHCNVCLAGSVMAFGLGIDKTVEAVPVASKSFTYTPSVFSDHTVIRLDALDDLRSISNVERAVENIYNYTIASDFVSKFGSYIIDREQTIGANFYSYKDDRIKWRRYMFALSAYLKTLNL